MLFGVVQKEVGGRTGEGEGRRKAKVGITSNFSLSLALISSTLDVTLNSSLSLDIISSTLGVTLNSSLSLDLISSTLGIARQPRQWKGNVTHVNTLYKCYSLMSDNNMLYEMYCS